MPEDLSTLNPLDLGPASLLVIVVLMILTGRLVPRRVLDDVTADRDHWREAALKERDARIAAMNQVEELQEFARTADHVIRSLPRPPAEEA